MKIALIGRTKWLIDAGKLLHKQGHEIVLVVTTHAESFYGTEEKDFSDFAKYVDAEFYKNIQLNSDDGLSCIRKSDAEIGVSVNWPSMLGKKVCEAFPHGILNAHAGDLPRYRGNACPNWAILNGEPHVGLCIHVMQYDKLDSGPVVCRDNFALNEDTYIGDVYKWLDHKIPELFLNAVDGLEKGNVNPEPQSDDPSLSLRCYPRRPEDSKIDWHQSSDQIHRLIRASSHPFSGAYTTLEGKERVTIWQAKPYSSPELFCAIPGQVMHIVDGDPVIACGSNALCLIEFSLEDMPSVKEARKRVTRSLRARLI